MSKSDDTISRQAANDEIARWIGYIDEDMILRIQMGLKKVPSAQRTGRWIFGHTLGHSWMKCSECLVSQDGQTACFSYCPNCGARMEASVDAG